MYTGEEKISQNLDTSFIKLIAAGAMLCDHIGKIFFPELILLQIIGRISFPVFSYCIVVGALYTKDIKKYMLRLGALAFFSQFIYIQAFAPGAAGILIYVIYKNVLFTLLAGLIAIYGLKEKKWIVFCATIILSFYVKLDYGVYGVLLIVSFYIFRENSLISFLIIALQLSIHFFGDSRPINILGLELGLRGFAVLGLPFIYIRTSLKPKISKYFFYIFYPGHIFVLYAIQMLV